MYNMSIEDPGAIGYSQIGGLGEQVRELREVGCPFNWIMFNCLINIVKRNNLYTICLLNFEGKVEVYHEQLINEFSITSGKNGTLYYKQVLVFAFFFFFFLT